MASSRRAWLGLGVAMPDLLGWWRRTWTKPDSLIPETWVKAAQRGMNDGELMCVLDDSPQAWAAIDAVLPLIARDPEVLDRAAEVCGRGLLAAGYGHPPLSRDLARDVLRAALLGDA